MSDIKIIFGPSGTEPVDLHRKVHDFIIAEKMPDKSVLLALHTVLIDVLEELRSQGEFARKMWHQSKEPYVRSEAMQKIFDGNADAES